MSNTPIKLAPGENIPDHILEQLKEANANKKGDFPRYLKAIEQIFGLDPIPPATTEKKYFLAGFIEGEGSINVSTKRLKTGRFGIIVDPEFSITQHVNGASHLHKALSLFQTGRIGYKSGSIATLVFVIDSRASILEKVIPFYEKYVKPNSSYAKQVRLSNFAKISRLLETGAHSELESMCNEVLPIWDEMRMQQGPPSPGPAMEGQSNQAFASLKEAQDFVTEFSKNKK